MRERPPWLTLIRRGDPIPADVDDPEEELSPYQRSIRAWAATYPDGYAEARLLEIDETVAAYEPAAGPTLRRGERAALVDSDTGNVAAVGESWAEVWRAAVEGWAASHRLDSASAEALADAFGALEEAPTVAEHLARCLADLEPVALRGPGSRRLLVTL